MTTKKEQRRIKIKFRIRKSVNGTAERPRLSVFRSNKQIYAQVINDLTGTTLASASSLGLDKMAKIEQAKKVGALVAEHAKAAGVEQVVFDRNGISITDVYRLWLMLHVREDLNSKRLWQ